MGILWASRVRLRRLGFSAACALTLGLGSNDNRAEAYRLYDNGAFDYIVPASQAIQWSADAWAPGSTLVWEIEAGPDWGLLLDYDADDFEPFVEAALSAWSGIRTADISWRLAGVEDLSDDSRFGDSRNRVFFDAASGINGAAALWVRNHTNATWEIAECDVGLPSYLVDRLEEGSDAEDLERWAIGFLLRETGHCLGLGRAAQVPASQRLRNSASGDQDWHGTAVWSPAPGMAWWLADSLARDDWIGASLLRPRTGWRSATGSVAGVLESDGRPVAYAHVYALRGGSGGMRDPVGAFSNADGEFLIEGLPPGEYVLWAHPIRFYWLHRPLILGGAETELKDTLALHPVSVTRGRVTSGITITMRRGRE